MGSTVPEKSTEGSNAAEGAAAQGNEEIQWTAEEEVYLFRAMLGNKLGGVHKNFHMVAICDKLSKSLNKDISSEVVWKHLSNLYSFEIIDELEGVAFPNDERDFALPESEYGPLMKQKLKEIVTVKVEDVEDRSTSPRITNTSRSSSRGAASKENNQKSSKKDQSEKQSKSQKDSNSSQNVAESGTPNKTNEKESKLDPRRDSKDSTSSNKETSKTPVSNNKSAKDVKSTKSSRSSVAEKLDESAKILDDSLSKRGNKRSTRGSMKSEEPTPPSRRRRI